MSVTPTRVAEALLAIMATLICCLSILVFRWRSGLATEPWSIASISSLLGEDVRKHLLTVNSPLNRITGLNKKLELALQECRFCLGYYDVPDNSGIAAYGIDVTTPTLRADSGEVRLRRRDPPRRAPSTQRGWAYSLPERVSQLVCRSIFLSALCGLLILILYYENTVVVNPFASHFEAFMDSQQLGVRSLFSGMGLVITTFWNECFASELPTLKRYLNRDNIQLANS
jgi:hypothetical protein